MNDDDQIKINFDQWFKDFDAKLNGTVQGDLFANTISTSVGQGLGSQYAVGSNTTGGFTWTTNGTGGYHNINPNIGLSVNDYWDTSKAGLHVKGDAEFDSDVKIKGKSITETLEKIEERLAILHPNLELESKWEKLRELRRQYIELEKDILEKEKIWNTLKK
jgi:hypothetical protein